MRSWRGRWDSTTAHVGGIALLVVAGAVAVGTLVEFVDGDEAVSMLVATLLIAALGSLLRYTTRTGELDRATVFTAVGFTWLLVSLVGTVPYLLAGTFVREGAGTLVVLADAFFESVSGYTASGSTIFGSHNPIEAQGSGILLYRQMTQWLGGMGIVVLVVAVLPSLRSSGLGRPTPRERSGGSTPPSAWRRRCSSWRSAWGPSTLSPTHSPRSRPGVSPRTASRWATSTALPWSWRSWR